MAKGKKTGGRVAGTPNRLGKTVKETFEKTFHEMQRNADSKASLVKWAKENPTEFYRIAARFIPLEVTGEMEHRIKSIEVVRKE